MMEAINGCPHEEGVDYPLGQVCSACPFWAEHRRLGLQGSLDPKKTLQNSITARFTESPHRVPPLVAGACALPLKLVFVIERIHDQPQL
jgi:hypothetical protein